MPEEAEKIAAAILTVAVCAGEENGSSSPRVAKVYNEMLCVVRGEMTAEELKQRRLQGARSRS